MTHWLVGERCRLVSIVGIGGLGKTTLVAQVVQDLATGNKQPFTRILWRSLLNAPPLAELLPEILHFLALPQSVVLPERLDKRLALLREYLTQERCLLVFDNLESLMEAGARGGRFRTGYADYGQLLDDLGRHAHQSCLLATSREQPQEVGRLERASPTVRSLALTGLSLHAGRELLHQQGLRSEAERELALIRRYSGHPLALMLVAETIAELYFGDIAAFLAEESVIFDDIRDVLDQHFARLSPLEQEIMTWLAIEREPMTAQALAENLLGPVNHRDYLEALRSLQRRTLLQSFPDGVGLQNVVTEYTTDRFVDQLCRELAAAQLATFNRYPLLKASAKEYVRESQARLLLQPVTARLVARFGRDGLLQQLRSYPARLRTARLHGYAAGNLLNWLLTLEHEVVNLDLSGLTIRQAYLRGKILHDLDLRSAAFKAAVFTETFDILRAVAFSPDGTLLVVGTDNGQLCFWQTRDWLLVQRWHISHDTIRSVAFSPDGRTLASADMAGQIQLWDLTNLSQVNQPQPRLALARLTSPVWSVCFSPDGRTLASGTMDQSLRLWNVATGEIVRIFHHDLFYGISSVCFSPAPNGSPRTLVCSSYKTIFLWDLHSGEAVQILQGHTDSVWSVCFSPDGKTLASSSSDSTIRLWDTTTWQTRQILTGHTGRVTAICFSPDGRILASGSSHGTIRLWAVNSGQALQILRGHTNWVASLCFSPDGRTLASASGDQSIRLWDMSTPDELVSSHPLQTFQGYRRGIRAICFSPDGATLASGGTDGVIRLWDAKGDGAEPRQVLIGHQILVTTVSFSPDGHTLATGDLRGFMHLWDLTQPETIVGQSFHCAPTVFAICFSPDRRFLAIGNTDHTIAIWDLATRQVIRTLTGHNEAITALSFSPDGQILASSNADSTILLWDFSAVSTLSEAEGLNTSVASGQIIQQFQEPGRVWSVVFSPDGHTLASGGDEGVIHLWDISTASTLRKAEGLNPSVAGVSDQPRQILVGHTAGINSVAFSPDGRLLVSGGIDQQIRLWDVASGQMICTLTGHTERVWSVCFSPDGQTVASGSDDGAVKFWDVATGHCLSTRRPDRPYERTKIAGVTGLTPAQISALKELGAVDEGP